MRVRENQRNPFPTYALLRERYPLCRIEPDGRYALSRYDDVHYALTHPDLFAVGSTAVVTPDWFPNRGMFVLTQDDPLHGQNRALVNKAFVTRVINALEPHMRQAAEALLQQTRGQPQEFLTSYAYPYTAGVIGRLLGTADSQNLTEISAWISLLERDTLERPTDDHLRAVASAYNRLDIWYRRLIEEHASSPQNDLITLLLDARKSGYPLSDDDIFGAIDLFLIAGFQTAAQLLSTALVYLSEWHDLRLHLTANPDDIRLFIEEMLRFDGPAQALLRITTAPVPFHGHVIPANTLVSCFAGAANRDPAIFNDPDTFQLHRRDARRHLGFGAGPHTCIGAALARLEVRVALQVILPNIAEIRCPRYSDIPWLATPSTRGMRALPLTFI